MFDRQWRNLNALNAAGFKVNPSRKLAKNFDEVWAFIEQEETRREELPYEIDGIVVKVDRTALQEELGTNIRWKAPALGDCLQIRGPGWHHAD